MNIYHVIEGFHAKMSPWLIGSFCFQKTKGKFFPGALQLKYKLKCQLDLHVHVYICFMQSSQASENFLFNPLTIAKQSQGILVSHEADWTGLTNKKAHLDNIDAVFRMGSASITTDL